MIPFQTKTKKLPGTNYVEVRKNALTLFNQLKKKTKRKPYLRSKYFKKQKIFFDFFWEHLLQKNHKERVRRLKFFSAAIELIANSKNNPTTTENPHKSGELLHRFAGLTKEKELFYVQIKEDKRSGAKYFMSCFPQE
ncbi:MAG TPA: hypothetical protein VJ046_02060 [Candidatus Paceibacterota bacterium]|nr:hypothetical protein [Candidatus Paceibacterota bacterium]